MSGYKNKCPHPECDRQKPLSLYACKDHWYTLPRSIRNRIQTAYSSGGALGNPDWVAADEEAVTYWKENP